jgi:hypothetical protein
VEVILPSLDDFVDDGRRRTSSRGSLDRRRGCRIYGGEQYGIFEDDDCYGANDDDDDHDDHDDMMSSSLIEVHGAGSCLVHDFLGIAGLEQCLVLPRIENTVVGDDVIRRFASSSSSSAGDDAVDMTEIMRRRGEMLLLLLGNSFMTDGFGMLLSDRTRRKLVAATRRTRMRTEVGDGVAASIVMPPLKISTHGVANTMKTATTTTTTTTTTTDSHDDGVMRSPSLASTGISTKGIPATATDISSTMTSRDADPIPPPWSDAIVRTIERRLGEEARETERLAGSIEAGHDLVNMGRMALHSAYSCPTSPLHPAKASGPPNEPVIERLRFGVRPRRSDEIRGGISATLDLEIDVTMGRRSTGASSPPVLVVLHDFHLSCSLASVDRRLPPRPLDTLATTATTTATPTNIRTICGVVPTLRSGDCVTILASVLLADLRICTGVCRGTTPTVDISIQGLWTDGDDSIRAPTDEATRSGAVLCLLRVPSEMLLMAPPITSPSRSGRWIQHEVNFTLDGQQHDARCSRPKPSAIFEYLQPQTIAIDMSGGSNCTQDIEMWQRFVSILNASVGGNSFVDLHYKKGDPKLKLVIFGSNPEERAGEFLLFLCLQLCMNADPAELMLLLIGMSQY